MLHLKKQTMKYLCRGLKKLSSLWLDFVEYKKAKRQALAEGTEGPSRFTRQIRGCEDDQEDLERKTYDPDKRHPFYYKEDRGVDLLLRMTDIHEELRDIPFLERDRHLRLSDVALALNFVGKDGYDVRSDRPKEEVVYPKSSTEDPRYRSGPATA